MCCSVTLTMVSAKNSLKPASSFETAKPTAPRPPTAAARRLRTSHVNVGNRGLNSRFCGITIREMQQERTSKLQYEGIIKVLSESAFRTADTRDKFHNSKLTGTWQREQGGVEADRRQADAGGSGLDGVLGLLRLLLHHGRRVALEQLQPRPKTP